MSFKIQSLNLREVTWVHIISIIVQQKKIKYSKLQDVTKCNFTKQHVVVNLTRDGFSISVSRHHK